MRGGGVKGGHGENGGKRREGLTGQQTERRVKRAERGAAIIALPDRATREGERGGREGGEGGGEYTRERSCVCRGRSRPVPPSLLPPSPLLPLPF